MYLDTVQKAADPVRVAADASPFFDQLQAVYDSIHDVTITIYTNEVSNAPASDYNAGMNDYMPTIGDSRRITAEDIFGSYAEGVDYVPRTGLYQLHQGERVTPANENGKGDRSIVYSPTFQINGSSTVTIEDVAAYEKQARAEFKKQIIAEVLG